jgi:CheY-like chemotaxis protein
MGQSTILIADDDSDILETLTFRLEQRGFHVVQAHDGEEAMQAFRASAPDLVILDVMMPKENGYRVARMIKEEKTFRKIPIILLTARNLEAYPDREKMFMDFSHAETPREHHQTASGWRRCGSLPCLMDLAPTRPQLLRGARGRRAVAKRWR